MSCWFHTCVTHLHPNRHHAPTCSFLPNPRTDRLAVLRALGPSPEPASAAAGGGEHGAAEGDGGRGGGARDGGGRCGGGGCGGGSIRKLRLEGLPLGCVQVRRALRAATPGLKALKLYGYALGCQDSSSSSSSGGSGRGGSGGRRNSEGGAAEESGGSGSSSSSSGCGVAALLQLLGPRLQEVTFQDCTAAPPAVAAVAAAPAAGAGAYNRSAPAAVAGAAAEAGATEDAQQQEQATDWAAPLLAALQGCSSLRYLGLRSATACCPLLQRLLLLPAPPPPLLPQPGPAAGTRLAAATAAATDAGAAAVANDTDVWWAVLGRLRALKLQSPLAPPSGSSLAPRPTYPMYDSGISGGRYGTRDTRDPARVAAAALCGVLRQLSGLTRLELGERLEEVTCLAPLLLLPPLQPQQGQCGGSSSSSGAQQVEGEGQGEGEGAGTAARALGCSGGCGGGGSSSGLVPEKGSLSWGLWQLRELDVAAAAVTSGEELAALAALTALTRLSLSAITVTAPPLLQPPQQHPLPPRLVELAVAEPLSPWALLALQPPPSLAVLRITGFVLDMRDTADPPPAALQPSALQPPVLQQGPPPAVAAAAAVAGEQQQPQLPEWGERMLPGSAAALAAALAALHGGRFAYRDLGIELHVGFSGPARGRRRYLLPPPPPPGSALQGLIGEAGGSSSSMNGSSSGAGCGGGSGGGDGHGVWLSQLGGVSGGLLQGLELAGLVLTAADLRLVARALPGLELRGQGVGGGVWVGWSEQELEVEV